jgi:hypothetical protein
VPPYADRKEKGTHGGPVSDLYIDGPMLERVKGSFRRIEDLLSGPARQMRTVAGAQMGPSALVDRVNEFGEEWS